jgi:hypothetical protein
MLSRLSTRRIYQWRPHSIRKPIKVVQISACNSN